jgi:site-specific DNA recombinase
MGRHLLHHGLSGKRHRPPCRVLVQKITVSAENSLGESFTRGHLYKLLSNPIYVGEVFHRGENYPGEHEAIIERATWSEVQTRLKQNGVPRTSTTNARSPSLLSGLLTGANGERLTPSHAGKSGRRYRYYVSSASVGASSKSNRETLRLPAPEIEAVVVREVAAFLRDPTRVLDALGVSSTSTKSVSRAIENAAALADQLEAGPAAEQSKLLRGILLRVDVGEAALRFVVRRRGLAAILDGEPHEKHADEAEIFVFETPITLKRRGVEAKLVLGNGQAPRTVPDRVLIDAVRKGHLWLEQLKSGQVRSVRELAKKLGTDRADMGRTLRLAFLAPDIVEAILAGRQPVTCTVSRLRRLSHLPLLWADQRRVLGFDA